MNTFIYNPAIDNNLPSPKIEITNNINNGVNGEVYAYFDKPLPSWILGRNPEIVLVRKKAGAKTRSSTQKLNFYNGSQRNKRESAWRVTDTRISIANPIVDPYPIDKRFYTGGTAGRSTGTNNSGFYGGFALERPCRWSIPLTYNPTVIADSRILCDGIWHRWFVDKTNNTQIDDDISTNNRLLDLLTATGASRGGAYKNQERIQQFAFALKIDDATSPTGYMISDVISDSYFEVVPELDSNPYNNPRINPAIYNSNTRVIGFRVSYGHSDIHKPRLWNPLTSSASSNSIIEISQSNFANAVASSSLIVGQTYRILNAELPNLAPFPLYTLIMTASKPDTYPSRYEMEVQGGQYNLFMDYDCIANVVKAVYDPILNNYIEGSTAINEFSWYNNFFSDNQALGGGVISYVSGGIQCRRNIVGGIGAVLSFIASDGICEGNTVTHAFGNSQSVNFNNVTNMRFINNTFSTQNTGISGVFQLLNGSNPEMSNNTLSNVRYIHNNIPATFRITDSKWTNQNSNLGGGLNNLIFDNCNLSALVFTFGASNGNIIARNSTLYQVNFSDTNTASYNINDSTIINHILSIRRANVFMNGVNWGQGVHNKTNLTTTPTITFNRGINNGGTWFMSASSNGSLIFNDLDQAVGSNVELLTSVGTISVNSTRLSRNSLLRLSNLNLSPVINDFNIGAGSQVIIENSVANVTCNLSGINIKGIGAIMRVTNTSAPLSVSNVDIHKKASAGDALIVTNNTFDGITLDNGASFDLSGSASQPIPITNIKPNHAQVLTLAQGVDNGADFQTTNPNT